jgi:hypothetical protein
LGQVTTSVLADFSANSATRFRFTDRPSGPGIEPTASAPAEQT